MTKHQETIMHIYEDLWKQITSIHEKNMHIQEPSREIMKFMTYTEMYDNSRNIKNIHEKHVKVRTHHGNSRKWFKCVFGALALCFTTVGARPVLGSFISGIKSVSFRRARICPGASWANLGWCNFVWSRLGARNWVLVLRWNRIKKQWFVVTFESVMVQRVNHDSTLNNQILLFCNGVGTSWWQMLCKNWPPEWEKGCFPGSL